MQCGLLVLLSCGPPARRIQPLPPQSLQACWGEGGGVEGGVEGGEGVIKRPQGSAARRIGGSLIPFLRTASGKNSPGVQTSARFHRRPP